MNSLTVKQFNLFLKLFHSELMEIESEKNIDKKNQKIKKLIENIQKATTD